MNPYPYGTSCPVSMHLALFAVNLALYGFGVLVSLKLAQDCTVRGQSLPGVTNDCDRAFGVVLDSPCGGIRWTGKRFKNVGEL